MNPPYAPGDAGHPYDGAVNLRKLGARVVWDLRGLNVNMGVAEAFVTTGVPTDWSAAVITFYRGSMGRTFTALQAATSLNANNLTSRLNLAGIDFLAAEVTTVTGLAGTADVVAALSLSAMLDPGATI